MEPASPDFCPAFTSSPTPATGATQGGEWTDFLGQVHDFTELLKPYKAKSEKDAKAHKLFESKGSKKESSKSAKSSSKSAKASSKSAKASSKGSKMFKEPYSMKPHSTKSEKGSKTKSEKGAKIKPEEAFRIFQGEG